MRKKSKKKQIKALVLFSGGLDSRLVCKMLQEQLGKKKVEAVFFLLPFGGGCCSDRFCVFRFSQTELMKLHIIDCTKGPMFKKYMGIIKNPKFRRGVAMNPCIDCHLFMLKEAKKLAKSIGADIIATGEVLGERPLSQHMAALELIERSAGLRGRVLRPLSAKLLPETLAERNGWVDRDKLLGISGRGRRPQMELARKYKITYPTPGGGCLLTDPVIAGRLVRLLKVKPEAGPDEIELLKLGRHFWVGESLIVVGRNHEENLKLSALAGKLKSPTLEVEGFVGPTTLIYGKASKSAIRDAALLTARYSDAPKGLECDVCLKSGKKVRKTQVIAPQDTDFMRKTSKKPKIIS